MTFLRVSSPRIANLEDVGNGCALSCKWGRGQGGEWCDLLGAPEGTCVQRHCPRRGWWKCYILLFGGCRKSYFFESEQRQFDELCASGRGMNLRFFCPIYRQLSSSSSYCPGKSCSFISHLCEDVWKPGWSG